MRPLRFHLEGTFEIMIKLEHLHYLLELNKTDSFRQCAEHLHCSQPAVSLAIKNLENELGVALIARNNSNIQLTAIGEEIAKRAKNIWADIYILANGEKIENTPFSPSIADAPLHFYATETSLSYVLPLVLFRLQKYTHGTKIITSESTPDETVTALTENTNALGLHFFWEDEIAPLRAQYPHLTIDIVCETHYYLAYSDTIHTTFERGNALVLEDYSKTETPVPLVIYGRSGNTTWDVMALLVDHHHAELVFRAPEEKMFYDYVGQGFATGLILQYGEIKPFKKYKNRNHLQFTPLITPKRCYFCCLSHKNMTPSLYERLFKYIQFSVNYL